MTWYRHRVVKSQRIPGVRFADDPRVEEVMAHLRHVAHIELSAYLRTHHEGQILVTEFVKPRREGTEVFVALTLFGPPSVEDEIVKEIEEGR